MKRMKVAIVGSGKHRHGPDDEDTQASAEHGVGRRHRHRSGVRGAGDCARGVATTHEGIEGLKKLPAYRDIDIVFDATSADAHVAHDAALRAEEADIHASVESMVCS
jgi:acetaldehyde dehydrogenase